MVIPNSRATGCNFHFIASCKLPQVAPLDLRWDSVGELRSSDCYTLVPRAAPRQATYRTIVVPATHVNTTSCGGLTGADVQYWKAVDDKLELAAIVYTG